MSALPSVSARIAGAAPLPDQPVAVVAGASRGLGLLIARELAARGCRVVGLARSAQSLADAADTMRGWGVEFATTYPVDVTDNDGLVAILRRVEDEIGPIDVAIHVAGVIQVGPGESMTREHFRSSLDIMLWGPINLSLAVVDGMRNRGRGRIGIVTSIGGKISVPHLLPYSTAKFGAVGFSDGLRADLAGSGVTATTIVPGLMRTGSHVAAEFTGDQAREYAWFAPSASLPLLSMDAERAAARIVEGVLAGRANVVLVLTPAAQIGIRIAGLAPGLTGVALGVVARILPDPPAGDPTGTGAVDGHTARRMLHSPLVEKLTTLGNAASARFNENRHH